MISTIFGISISKSWVHMIQFDPIWNLSKTLSKRGWQQFLFPAPHLSPPFFSDLPAELQHIERRNFVGTQLEKAAEDANLEAMDFEGWVFVMTGQPYLPWKPAEKKTTMVTLR